MERINNLKAGTFTSPKKILGFLVIFLLASSVLAYTLSRGLNTQDTDTSTKTPEKNISFDTPYTIVYGSWTTNETYINAYNLDTGKEYNLATLPINVKKVTILNDTQILYIADTDSTDHGTKLVIKNIKTGEDRTIYNALEDFGIDDYEVSQNGKYIATWEVKLSSQGPLSGGQSRVMSIDTQNSQVNTIVAEVATENTPVHYPLAVTNDGQIFMDTFLPNSGAGWAYGMSVSNFEGTQQQDIPGMANGRYGTQPELSPDGQFFVFAGYTNADGAELDEGFRKALVSPNTIQTLNTSTFAINTLPNLPFTDKYFQPQWNSNSEIQFFRVSQNAENTANFIYNLATNSTEKLEQNNNTPIKKLENNKILYGTVAPSTSSLGNLGETYEKPYTQISLKNTSSQEEEQIPLSSSLIQLVDIVPNTSKLMESGKEISGKDLTENSEEIDSTKESLKLKAVTIKEELVPTRTYQQSDPVPRPTTTIPNFNTPNDNTPNPEPTPDTRPRCPDIVDQRCGQKPSGPSTICDDKGCHGNPDLVAYNQCTGALYKSGTCQDSPLYLYGPEGLNVNVKIHTSTYNENIPPFKYQTSNINNPTYSFTLGENGKFYSQGNIYSSLSYDYIPANTLRPPLYGKVVKKENIEKTVRNYAKNLGLNTRETKDLVKDITSKVTKNYAFITFYDQQASKYILPLSFTPGPDTYINYAFYVRNLNTPQELGYSPKEPIFEKTPRGEFTAVEISVIAD